MTPADGRPIDDDPDGTLRFDDEVSGRAGVAPEGLAYGDQPTQVAWTLPDAPESRGPAVFEGAKLGRFEIVRELGRGGFGVVYLARDPVLGREVALKVPRPELVALEEVRRRFLREGRAAADLDHPNLVPVYESGEAGPSSYIASLYCTGPTLAAWLSGRSRPVPPRLAADLMAQLADGVAHANGRGVLHRDIKPSNILLQGRGTSGDDDADDVGLIPRLVDFGLARVAEAAVDQTLSGVPLGSPAYMAPEQASGRHREVGPPTDVHGLGVTLYEILTGTPPYRAATPLETLRRVIDDDPVMPRVLRADLPRDLDAIIRRCLEKAPGHRYPTAGALADDLRRYLDGRPVLARPDGPGDRFRRWTLRPERVRDAGLALTCLGLINVLLNALCWAGYLAGILRPTRPAAFVRDLLIALLVHDLPVLWFGVRTLRGSRWGLRLGLGVSCYFLAGLVWSVIWGPYYDFGGIFGEAQGRLPFEVTLIIFVGGATALAVLALPADRARRAAREPRHDADGRAG